MKLLSRKKAPAKKAEPKKAARSVSATIKKEYNEGANYADLAEKHKMTVEEVAKVVEA